MLNIFDQKLEIFSHPEVSPLLCKLQHGIEKEGLRTTADGHLAMSPHPPALGSALTNSSITTDFSENLLEFITPVFTSIDDTLQCVEDIHRFTYQRLDQEYIWATSMPCVLPADSEIPLAHYGSSNIGTMKTVYRRGLGHRYGRAMQTVAGIHYNFSLPEKLWDQLYHSSSQTVDRQTYITQQYLNLIRNFRRNYWLLIFLLGSAPAVDRSFVLGRQHKLEPFGKDSLFASQATSLRMGDLGYQSAAQKSLFVCYNELDSYIETLGSAITTPYEEYKQFQGNSNQVPQQLSTSLLQIENEFYSPIRPKRVTQSGEKPLHALSSRGIEYIEVRCLDLDPFCPTGISAETIRFLDCFLLHCLSQDSPLCTPDEFRRISENQARIVNHGLDPSLKIFCHDNELPMRDCATTLLNEIGQLANTMDNAHNTNRYSESISAQRDKISDTSKLPAEKIKTAMKEAGNSHLNFGIQTTMDSAQYFKQQALPASVEQKFDRAAKESLQEQKAIENSDTQTFEQFLKAYFEQ